jgi:hypothetical protein
MHCQRTIKNTGSAARGTDDEYRFAHVNAHVGKFPFSEFKGSLLRLPGLGGQAGLRGTGYAVRVSRFEYRDCSIFTMVKY